MAPATPTKSKAKGGGGLDLPRPFSAEDQRLFTKKIDKLIKKREKMNKKMKSLNKMTTTDEASAQLQREQQEDLQRTSRSIMKREQKLKTLHTNILEEREKLRKADPSNAKRAEDVTFLKTMLAKLESAGTPKSSKRKAYRNAVDDALPSSSSSSDSDFEYLVSENDNHSTIEPDLGNKQKSPSDDVLFSDIKKDKRSKDQHAEEKNKKKRKKSNPVPAEEITISTAAAGKGKKHKKLEKSGEKSGEKLSEKVAEDSVTTNTPQSIQANMSTENAATTKNKKGGDTKALEQKTSSGKSTPKGPTPIPIPRIPTYSSAGRIPFNPFLGLRKFSTGNPEPEPFTTPPEKPKVSKPTSEENGQTWVLNSASSRKKNKRSDSDAKSVTLTIGKVETPYDADQESPTPPSKKDKKEKKKRGRPKKTKGSVATQQPSSAAEAQSSVSAVHASGGLIQSNNAGPRGLLAQLGPGAGPIPRSQELQKAIDNDRLMFAQEREALLKSMRF
ncbi:hypothetical protein CkaCkLH20_05877 [Colletotrichum karsti]|uniref:Uncharacterized protein n=1 Tax=Colletotrichum karsti TaxID=1095194 RepID=A0A9P6I580_9PEZI|nr:uncharacterized protein CkaCkLH20_05877 [Colletotrichum karsti]KAF9876469.1 hypothetical protein CkaCkLH20_05877 [Colletotrichum karsti]